MNSLSGEAPAPVYIRCQPRRGVEDWELAVANAGRSADNLELSSPAFLRQRQSLLDIAADADAICARSGVRHTIVFYTLPSTPAGVQRADTARQLNDHARGLENFFSRRPRDANGCRHTFVDLASDPPGGAAKRNLWLQRDYWSDYTHFSPQLGSSAIDALLDVARALEP